jgi:hypothetical protein
MIFFNVIQNISPGLAHYVETTISGYCLFTKFESRAKLFTLEEADELAKHLRTRKPKNHYAKIQAQIPTQISNGSQEIFFTPPGNKISDHGSDPEEQKERSQE